jgi:hypothetical protein
MDGVRLWRRQIEIRRDHPYHSLGRKHTLKNKMLMNRPDDFMLLFWNMNPKRPSVGFADDSIPRSTRADGHSDSGPHLRNRLQKG